MSNEFKLHVNGAEIITHVEKQIAQCHKAVGRLEEEHAAIAKLPHRHGPHPHMFGGTTPDHVKDVIEQLEFLRDHVESDTDYVLTYHELQELQLVPMAPPSSFYAREIDLLGA
ncbi:hypothetical protein LCGC14_3039960 [marine sediment metagenome]|uniref:Uncharacterized protein n=1 Tax=marine sediment metagenome TaxID=412755 RepID=A0A0F8ZFX0_9ZZZZ